MPAESDTPFGPDTLTLEAIVVREDGPSLYDVALAFGGEHLSIPAVLVPPGGTPPGYPFIHVGQMPADAAADGEPVDSVPAAFGGPAEARSLPRGRSRIGAGGPPTPGAGGDPVAAGVKTWRGMAAGRRVGGARDTGAGVMVATVVSGVPVESARDGV